MPAPWQDVLESFRRAVGPPGLELVTPFRVGWFDAVVDADLRLGTGSGDRRLGLVVGSTRTLWPAFLAWLAADPARLDLEDPLDRHVEGVVARAVAVIPQPTTVRFAHHGPPWLAIQRVAEVAGLARRSPSRLAVHPVHGPWIALRAAVVVEIEGPAGNPLPCPDPCAGCTATCRERLAAAEAATAARGGRGAWREWLAVRDACPVGREHRSDDDALRSHALSDRDLLRRLVTTTAGDP